MRPTKQQRIEQLEAQIKSMYSAYDYNNMVKRKDDEINSLKEEVSQLRRIEWAYGVLRSIVNRLIPVPDGIQEKIDKETNEHKKSIVADYYDRMFRI